MECLICRFNGEMKEFSVREMMLGLKESFRYHLCPSCGTLRIESVPANMTPYYPTDYYSFFNPDTEPPFLKKIPKAWRDKYMLTGNGLAGRVLAHFFKDEAIKAYSGIPLNSRLLDVGCGSGLILRRLKAAGFSHVSGIDPLIGASVVYRDGVEIRKHTIDEEEGQWDLIIYNHSFEHIAHPLKELKNISRLLAEGGRCILRVPVMNSWAWEHYGTDWVQLDAPRHIFIHSIRGLEILALESGLRIAEIKYDSTSFQFWGSEQYRKDIPLNDPRSFSVNPGKSIFSKRDLRDFARRSSELNRSGRGDQAVVTLNKLSETET